MASFDLPIPQAQEVQTGERKAPGFLPAELLADNVLWFCRLRWMVIGFLSAVEVVSAAGGNTLLAQYGIYLSSRWPLACAALLAGTNILFLLHGRRLRKLPNLKASRANLVLQIVSDLIVLTAVVHFVGSVETFVSFTYLFHVVLACIFFSSGGSSTVRFRNPLR